MDMSTHGIDPKLGETPDTAAKRRMPRGVYEAIAIAVLIGLLVLGIATRLWTYLPQGTGQ